MKSSCRLIKRFISAFLCILILFSLVSCDDNPDDSPRLYIDDYFSWAPGSFEDTIEDAQNYTYKKLERMGYKNIMDVAGSEGKYVWLKAEFKLPEELKNDELSMVVPYLHFAEELYLNGKYIDDYGTMGEDASSLEISEAGYGAHLFDFPEFYLEQEGINTIHIKIFALGSASITDGVFIGTRRDGWVTADNQTFWRSRIYVFLEGGMLICGIFFFVLYIAFKRKLSYLRFAIMNILTIIFFSNFFMTDVPWAGFHGGIPFIWYFKITKCICFLLLEVEFSLFLFAFLNIKDSIVNTIIRDGTFLLCSGLVLRTPNYYTLMKLTYPILIISSYNFISPVVLSIWHYRDPEKRKEAKIIISAIIPLLVTIFADFVLKSFVMDIKHLYFSVFGWVGFILIFFIYFSLNYSKIANRLEYLNQDLEKEIKRKTDNITAINEKLEHDKEMSTKDMKMAALVQKSFFHVPPHPLDKWDFSVKYEPYSIVSGDLYNFYHKDKTLNGISLFDASGHGVAASLVTMLAENIIQEAYAEMLDKAEDVSSAIKTINERFIAAKSDIENYLTGLLLNMKENDDGSCTITMANAGHPNPILYCAETDEVEELLPSPEMPYTGPVGLSGFNIDYCAQEFIMKKGDVLILYTDGLTEMMSEERLEYSVSRVIALGNKKKGITADEIMKALMEKLDNFTADNPRNDDISVIVLRRL